MFSHDDSFIEASLSGADSSSRRYLHTGNGSSFINHHNYDEFSFKLNQSREAAQKSLASYQSHNNTFSLRENLQVMDKDEIIELFLEQIKSSQQNKDNFSYHNSAKTSPKAKVDKSNQDKNFQKQYEELVKGFEEYIGNTREAQDHFIRTIEQLKKQNQDMQRSINKMKSENISSTKSLNSKPVSLEFSKHQKSQLINKLEQTIEKYLEINNQLIGKVEKLQRAKEQDSKQMKKLREAVQQLQFQCDTLDKENDQLQKKNQNYKTIIQELKDYIKQKRQAKDLLKCDQSSFGIITQRLKDLKNHKPTESAIECQQPKRNQAINESTIFMQNSSNHKKYQTPQSFNSNDQIFANDIADLQIQNKEKKLVNMKLEDLLEKKSQKIRNLLEEIETISEEKMLMKQEIFELKSSNKQNLKSGDLREGQSINETLSGTGGLKMASSSIYSLKNSQSTCLQTSKGPKPDEATKQGVKQAKSAIRQAYKNCFQKSPNNESAQKTETNQIRNEACYMPKVNQFSSKKSSNPQEQWSEFGKEIRAQNYGMIRKRSQMQS